MGDIALRKYKPGFAHDTLLEVLYIFVKKMNLNFIAKLYLSSKGY